MTKLERKLVLAVLAEWQDVHESRVRAAVLALRKLMGIKTPNHLREE